MEVQFHQLGVTVPKLLQSLSFYHDGKWSVKNNSTILPHSWLIQSIILKNIRSIYTSIKQFVFQTQNDTTKNFSISKVAFWSSNTDEYIISMKSLSKRMKFLDSDFHFGVILYTKIPLYHTGMSSMNNALWQLSEIHFTV